MNVTTERALKTQTADSQIDKPLERVPYHLAIIMDGNGRWAKSRGLPRLAGHKAGVENLRRVLRACSEFGMGFMAFTPLAQGMLTDKYLTRERPAESRLDLSRDICAERLAKRDQLEKVRRLNEIALRRGQTLAQLAIMWLLHRPEVTSVLIGASRPQQIEENVAALDQSDFSTDELREIDTILQG